MPLTIYFAGSISGGRDDAGHYRTLVRALEAGGHRVVRRIDFGVDDGAREVRGRQPLAADLDRRVGHGQADGDLVGADLVGALGADPVVRRQHEERPHRQRVAAARDDHRQRKRQQALRQLEALSEHAGRVGAAGGEHAEVEPG